MSSFAFACLSALLRRRVRRAKLLAPDAVFGLKWSGEFTAERLLGVLRQLPRGVVEIYMHPATEDHFREAAHGYRYSDELRALCANDVLVHLRRLARQPVGYADVVDGRDGSD